MLLQKHWGLGPRVIGARLLALCGGNARAAMGVASASISVKATLSRSHIEEETRGVLAFLLTVGAFLLTVKLLCLQSLKPLIRHTFPL